MTISRLLARPMMSAIFVVGPITTLRNTSQAAKAAEPVTGPLTERLQQAGVPVKHNPEMFVRVNAGVQIAGAVALASGKCPRLAAGVLAATLVPTTIAGHPFWRETDPAARAQQRVQFAKNISLLGGLIIAAMDTDGKPGKAWLARNAVKRATRHAEHLATVGKLETKVAALEAAGAGDHLAETLESATGQAREAASHWGAVLADQARDKGPVLAERARTTGAVLADQALDKGSAWADQAGDASKEWRKELRKQAKRQRKQARKAGARFADVARDRGSDWADTALEKGSEWADQAGDATEEWRKELRKQAKKQGKHARKTGRKLVKEARAKVA